MLKNSSAPNSGPLSVWKSVLVADLERVALRDRWGLALAAIGWIHLGVMAVCQALYSQGDRKTLHFLSLWALEFAANLWILRRIAGPGWHRASPLGAILVRVWATFLILSFNVASLNTLTGWSLDWFKPVWATLSTFGFATTAYLVNPWYFVPAVSMYFTGLIMVSNPGWPYLIYGLSWWVTLEGIGLILERKRARQVAGVRDASEPVASIVEEAAA
jgi:hypothetical protein